MRQDQWEALEPVPLPDYSSNYERITVFGDIHGDLDTMARSMAAKRIVRYQGDEQALNALIERAVHKPFSTALEKLVIKQRKPLLMVFIGDLLDRFDQGYHVIQFLHKIRWEKFRINPVFIMGNHDLMNLQFFINPFQIHRIHEHADVARERQAEFISRMGLGPSVMSFVRLHQQEIRELQTQFYRKGRLSVDLGYARLNLRYPKDLSILTEYRGETVADWSSWLHQTAAALKLDMSQTQGQPWQAFRDQLMTFVDEDSEINWWNIQPPGASDHYQNRFDTRIESAGLLCDREPGPDTPPHTPYEARPFRNALPVDWRVVSIVWRKHYGDFFKRMRIVHLDGNTLFAHGGLSAQSMIDTLGFGILYQLDANRFDGIQDGPFHAYSLATPVERINRLARQAVINALNDYSFEDLTGLEIWDDLGGIRGEQPGFTQFGGFVWTDFNQLNGLWDPSRIIEIYRAFLNTTKLRRVICGHTRFQKKDDGLRYLIDGNLLKLGLESLCVDNSSSRGYRGDKPVLTGIEINAAGEILDPGEPLSNNPW